MKKNLSFTSKKRNFLSRNGFFILIYIFLFAFALFIIFNLAFGLITSLRSATAYNNAPIGLPILKKTDEESWNAFFHLENYNIVLKNFKIYALETFYSKGKLVEHDFGEVGIAGMFINTILYACGGAFFLAFMPAFVAYLCAKYPYKWSKFMFLVYMFIMCVPIVGNYPSEVTFLRNTLLYDQIWGNYIQKMGGAGMYFFVFFAFFKGLPDTYREAAEIDGASEFKIMFRIYFPLALKIIGTVYLIQLVALWNDFTTPYLYLKSHPTLSYGVYYLAFNQTGMVELQSSPVKLACCMMLALPILIIFIIFKDKLMGNLSLGGIKE